MQITRQADYATRAILYLARAGTGERIATSQVAKEQKIPPSFLAKIISQLSIAGLLHTSRGARGGISPRALPSRSPCSKWSRRSMDRSSSICASNAMVPALTRKIVPYNLYGATHRTSWSTDSGAPTSYNYPV